MLEQKEYDDLVAAAKELIGLATDQADLEALEEAHWMESIAERALGRTEEATRALEQHAAVCRKLGRSPRSG